MNDQYDEMWKEIGEGLSYFCKVFIISVLMLLGICGLTALILKGIGAF